MPGTRKRAGTARRSWLPAVILLIALCLAQFARTAFAEGDPPLPDGGPSAKAANQDIQKFVFPILYDPPAIPLPVIRVRINGSEPLFFLVDTGANTGVILQYWAVQALHFDTMPDCVRTDVTYAGRKFQDLAFARRPVFAFPLASGHGPLNITYAGPRFFAETSDGDTVDTLFRKPRIAGIIGLLFFGTNTLQFDFAHKTLTVYIENNPAPAPGSVPSGAPAAAPAIENSRKTYGITGAHPLRVRQAPGVEPLLQVRVDAVEGYGSPAAPASKGQNARQRDEWVLVDTGSWSTILPERLLKENNVPAVLQDTLHQSGSQIPGHRSLLKSLTVSGVEIPQDRVVSSYPEAAGATCVLGTDILSHFRVTLNAFRGLLYLEPNSAESADNTSRIVCFCGLSFEDGKDGTHRITDIDPNLKGLGFAIGDEIVEIDGYPLAKYSHSQARLIADSYAGTVACCVVRHRAKADTSAPPATLWFVRPNSFGNGPQTTPPAPVRFHLIGPTRCRVVYKDGKSRVLPFHCNPGDAPEGPAPAGQEYVRRWTPDFGNIWVLVPEGPG